ncbi:hypothetical protein QLX67_00235 [Balneolaceae bacterium ANBcel3]|nr:hypothetical protein [Balneolaceae bacterium ANBcel3]
MNVYTNIEQKLRSLYRTLYLKRITSAVLLFFCISAVFFLLLASTEYIFYLSAGIKSTLLFAGIVIAGLSTFIFLQTHRSRGFIFFYRKVSDSIGISSLKHLLDLHLTDRKTVSALKKAAIEQNIESIQQAGLEEKLSDFQKKHPAQLWFRGLLALTLVIALLLPAANRMLDDAFQRTLVFWEHYSRPNPFEYTLAPGDTIMEQGRSFQAVVTFKDREPEQVRLGIRTGQEQEFRLQGMSRTNDLQFSSREIDLFEDIEYYVEMDGFRSPTKRIGVELLPRLQDLVVVSIPPSYTGLESDTARYPFNRLEVIAGSEIEIHSAANKPLSFLKLIAEAESDTASIAADEEIYHHFLAETDSRYHFKMQDEHGLRNSNPFRFRISVTHDRAPSITILSPERHVNDFLIETVPLLYEYEDDFGFTSLTLNYRYYKAFVDVPIEGREHLSVPGRARGLGEFDWDIRSFEPGSMDRIEYWLEITDNNAYSGYQQSRSDVHIIEIPSLASRLFEQEEREEEIDQRFSEVDEAYQRMRDNIQRLRDEIRINPDDDWEQTQMLEEIGDQRKDLERQIEELRNQFEELTRDMESQDLMSEETLRQYQELQQLLDEIDDPELLELLENMRQNLQQMDQSQLRQQLDEIEFNEERYKERLQRTMELFKSLRLQSDLNKLSRHLSDLQEQERTLSESEQYGREEINKQEMIQEQFQKIMEQLEQLPAQSPNRRMEQMQELYEEMHPEMEQINEMLDQNLDKMKDRGSPQDEIRQQQQNISQGMEQMSGRLNDMIDQMQQQSISINIQALQRILETLILLSEEQEDIIHKTNELTANSPGFVEQARRQNNVNRHFATLSDSLYRVSSEIPQFSNRINDRKHDIQRHMDRALQFLIERNRSRASAQERSALGGVNEMGTMLADLLDQLSQMGGGDGEGSMSLQQMMEQMQQMSQDQQELNQQIQEFINDMQGERLTRDHMERLDQMARQQNEIREQLRRLQQQSGRGGDRLMSEIQRLSEEMEDTINDLRGGSTDEILVQRQQNILSRMLEVEESVYKRDEDEEERLGETAEDYERRSVQELTLEELRQRVRAGVEQSDYSRFNEEYQKLIERYFQLIEEYLEGNASSSLRAP